MRVELAIRRRALPDQMKLDIAIVIKVFREQKDIVLARRVP